jgi:hypothetical protein
MRTKNIDERFLYGDLFNHHIICEYLILSELIKYRIAVEIWPTWKLIKEIRPLVGNDILDKIIQTKFLILTNVFFFSI